MIDFTKKIHQSDKFRQPALTYIRTGQYCQYPKGTSEYMSYWTTEQDRCINGYTADDGDFISGYNYFYLNYCPILRIVNKEVNGKVKSVSEVTFPDFWDYDYYYFQTVEEAERQGKHLCVLKSRRRGYSYKAAAMMCRNYYLIPNSSSYVYASNKQYLTDDGVLTKAWNYMDFIDEYTAWGKKRSVNTQLRRRAGMWVKDEYGNQIEVGYKSEIIGVTLKDNPDVVRGRRANLILFEEAGSFKELSAAWQIARPSVEIDGKAFATMIAYGTGGDEESNFFTLKDMFYHPEGYNCLALPNIWDENVSNTECGFFVPQYTNMDLRDEQGKRLYMDEDGNTLTIPARQYILEERRKVIENSTNSVAVDRYVAERPCLDKNTWISTEDGVCRIKDNPKAWITGVKDIYKVTTDDGAELLCTKDHPIFNGEEYIELKKLKIGDTIKYHPTIFGSRYQTVRVPGLIPASDIDFVIDEEWGKFIGLFMGDGFYYGPSGTVGIVFDKRDINSLEWCEKFLEKNIGRVCRRVIGKNNGGITITVCRKNSIEFFKALGLAQIDSSGRLKRKVHVPDYIMKSPKSVVSAFLSGLFDSDGYSSEDGKHIGFFNKEKQVLLDMQFLLRGFDIHPTVRSRPAVNGNGFNYTENKLNIRISDIPKFREQIGFISSRKNANISNTEPARKHPNFTFTTITNIEYVKTDEVWDITTETHYLSANGIWVHNCTPAEACLEFNGNIFPKKELQEQLGKIRTNKLLSNHKQVGDLIWESDGSLKWLLKKNGDITHYPLNKNDDPTGSIVIWEHPVKDAPIGLYIIGVDPYDHDQSGTNSLGSCFVYKRFQNFENYYDLIVAEYTGRPSTAEEFYENVRKLAIYYNARIMYENQNKGLFPYFVAKHCDYLLADQPDILNDIIGNSKVNRKKGCHMNKQIKQWGEGLIKDWLNDEKAPGHKNLHDILSEPLLEELIGYNDLGNFDRVMALIQVMIYREQLYNVVVKEKKKQNKSRLLFDGPIFNEDSWYDDTMNNVEEDVYTFN